ncbi:MAG: hypothetical protein FJZ01_14185 [Candidatus Sericytochromatia bacterium]|nr:hypothetical protein [Candidatus Tanganyikabacteria bacterium]
MDRIAKGRFFIYHLFELAEEVDLTRLRQIWADSTVGQLAARRNAPDAIRFRDPPVILPLGARPLTSTYSGSVRAKIFDFGVCSIAWELDTPESWEDLIALSVDLQDDIALESASRRVFDEVRSRALPACKDPIPDSKLVEDYYVIHVAAFDSPARGEDILARHGADLAHVLRGDAGDLSADERRDALRLRHSYRSDDLVVVTYNSAFVYDAETVPDHVDVIEFANAQLLDLRYYDQLMDQELALIYDSLEDHKTLGPVRGKLLKTVQQLHRLMIEIHDIREKIRNSLKIVGEMYSARIYRMISDSLRLERWDQALGDKLDIAQQIYKVLLEELHQRRSNMLEIIIILLILLEVILFIFPMKH